MQLAKEVCGVLSKHPERILMDWFRIKFTWKKREPPKELTPEQRGDLSVQQWCLSFGLPIPDDVRERIERMNNG